MKIGDYHTHPAADTFDLLITAESNRLTDDIRANGLLIPIALYDGQVLDGRNRLMACLDAGVKPVFEDWSGRGDPWKLSWGWNVERRHMPVGAKAVAWRRHEKRRLELLGAEAESARSESKKGNRNAAKNKVANVGNDVSRDRKNTRKAAAKEAGVSTGTMSKAEALDDSPDLQEQVIKQKISLDDAYRAARGKPNKPKGKREKRCPHCGGLL
jgi:hypothetical protein